MVLDLFPKLGPRPLEKDGFHSFIEDWNRSTGAAGHTVFREAEFFNTDAQIDMVSTGKIKVLLIIWTKEMKRKLLVFELQAV